MTPADGVVVTDVATSAGPVRLAVVPVTAGEAVGSYVIGHAVGLEKAALRELAGLWAILGAATLAVIAVVGWLVTGELVRPLARLRRILAPRTRSTAPPPGSFTLDIDSNAWRGDGTIAYRRALHTFLGTD